MVLTSVASADDVADVKTAVLELLAAMNAGDVHAWTQKHTQNGAYFSMAANSYLKVLITLKCSRNRFNTRFGSGPNRKPGTLTSAVFTEGK